MKDGWTGPEVSKKEKKINKKKIIGITLCVIVIVLAIVLVGAYNTNKQVREWIDKNIFRKEVVQDKVATIELKENENVNAYAFNKYIGILNKTKFSIYGNTGNKEKELDIQISNPIFNSANRFLTIAEKNGQKLYLVSDKDIAWENTVEGNISQVYVNKNGYVAVVTSDTIHKTVIKMYNSEGTPLFSTYLSSTRAVDVSISNDNKHLAIAELDTSGTIIQSSIRIMSIDKAETDPTNSLEKTYTSESGKMITNINYQDKNRLVCMYVEGITEIEEDQEKVLVENKNKKVIFQSIDLNNKACSVEEKSSGLFTADSIVNIVNTENGEIKQYVADSVTKEMYTQGDIIALNLGTEVEFLSTSGWLVKRYVANQEITNIVVSDNIAGVIYKDKIDIVNL